MNNQKNNRPPVRPVGGANRRPETQGRAVHNVKGQQQRPPADLRRTEYTQMPLRPMTSMPRDRQAQPQRSVQQRPVQQRPLAQQRPPVQGQRPVKGAPRPQQVPLQRQTQGQRPAHKRPVQSAPAMPNANAKHPPVKGQKGQGPRNHRPAQVKDPRRRQPERNGWIVPEGSPVYTAQGRMYDGRRQSPDPRTSQRKGVGNQRPAPKKKKKAFNKEKFLFGVKTFFIRFAAMLLIVALLGLWWYRAEFYSDNSSRSGKVSFALEGIGEYEAKASLAFRGEVLYVDFTEIAEWLGMVSVGSVNSMRFICTEGVSETSSGKGGEEYAIFSSGSTTVLVNGQSLSLEAACRTVDSHIWVPLSFVENYVSGIECDRGAKGTDVTFTPEGAEDADEGEEITVEASFMVKSQTALSHVEYPE